jgi:hypothetical protein
MGLDVKPLSLGKLTPAVIGRAIDDAPVSRNLFFLIFICMFGALFGLPRRWRDRDPVDRN